MSFGSLGFWRKRRLTASPRLQHLQTRSNVAQTNEADKQWMVLAELARRQKQSGVELAFLLDRFWLSTEEGKAYLLSAGSPIPHNTSRYRTNFQKIAAELGPQKGSKGIAGMALSRLLGDSKFASPFPTESQKELEKQWLGGKPTNNRNASAITAIV